MEILETQERKMNKKQREEERTYTLFRTLPTTEIGKRSWAIDREAYNNTAERIVEGTKKRVPVWAVLKSNKRS